MEIRTIIAATCLALAISMAGPLAAHDGQAETVAKNFEAAIPNIPGKSLIALEVNYAPGAASPPHTHAKSSFIYAYVISGAIESKVNDGETRIYRAGESWAEPPGATHSISRNASRTEPAKLLAVFVLDTNDNPLTTPIKQTFRRIEWNEGPRGTSSKRQCFRLRVQPSKAPAKKYFDYVAVARAGETVEFNGRKLVIEDVA